MNDAWLVIRATLEPVLVDDVPSHVYIVQDAASMYIFGNTFAPADAQSPSAGDAALVLTQAWQKKRTWPKKLIIPGTISEKNGFAAAAKLNKVQVELVQPSEATIYIQDVQSAYAEFIARDAGDA